MQQRLKQEADQPFCAQGWPKDGNSTALAEMLGAFERLSAAAMSAHASPGLQVSGSR